MLARHQLQRHQLQRGATVVLVLHGHVPPSPISGSSGLCGQEPMVSWSKLGDGRALLTSCGALPPSRAAAGPGPDTPELYPHNVL